MAFRLLVCGGRDFSNARAVDWALSPYIQMPTNDLLVIEGGATGADRMAREWAEKNGATVMEFPANWTLFGKAAGPIRNNTMLRWGQPDTVLAFPGGRGTAHMVTAAKRAGIDVVEVDPSVIANLRD